MTTDPRTQWKEIVQPDEDAVFKGFADDIVAIRTKVAKGGLRGRSLHTKGHVNAEAELTVRADLPDELKVSLFAKTGPQRCYVRFSNGLGRAERDGAPDVRGLAVKVLDVPGPKLIPGLEGATTQDFLLITTPVFAISTPGEFVKLIRCAEDGVLKLLPNLVRTFGFGRALSIAWRVGTMPSPASLATATFYSVAPMRFGPFAAKLSLASTAHGGNIAKGRDGYRADLVTRLKTAPLEYKLRAQLFVDEATTPIEDIGVEWTEQASPWIELATLKIPSVDLTALAPKALEEKIEAMSFDPWHATDELRPIGAIMRARKFAYGGSVIARKAAPEPGSA